MADQPFVIHALRKSAEGWSKRGFPTRTIWDMLWYKPGGDG